MIVTTVVRMVVVLGSKETLGFWRTFIIYSFLNEWMDGWPPLTIFAREQRDGTTWATSLHLTIFGCFFLASLVVLLVLDCMIVVLYYRLHILLYCML